MELMEVLTQVIDELMAAGPGAFGDGESICALKRQAARLNSFICQATNEFDIWGGWASDGARSPASWLSHRNHEPIRDSRQQVARGRGLRQLPVASQAFSEGEISASHVDALLAVRNARTEDALSRDEELLVDQ